MRVNPSIFSFLLFSEKFLIFVTNVKIKYMHGFHRGYLYQDLVAALLISENLHKKDFRIGVEYMEKDNDIFDDIIIVADGNKTKFQIKHSSNNEVLNESDFTKSNSSLNLTKLGHSFSTHKPAKYVVATNRTIQASQFFVSQKTQKIFPFRNKVFRLNPKNKQNKNFIKCLSIEANLPNASFDLYKPGNLENELLRSLITNVGIGYYPNNQVLPRDVAGRLVLLVNSLRTSKNPRYVDRDYIFQQIGLNFEYGHVAQSFPFISPEYRIHRRQITQQLEELVTSHKFTVLEGSPGIGKSHLFDDLFQKFTKDNICAARHYCYLETTDQLAQDRILIDTMYGNFLDQLKKLEPKLAQDIKPYFAATKKTVEKLVERIIKSGKRVVLMIDGLDHLIRVVKQNNLSSDLIHKFITGLLEIRLPEGSSIFIASQPSNELTEIIKKKRAKIYLLKPWSENLTSEFLIKHNQFHSEEKRLPFTPQIAKLLTEKTEGNPLYLTYVVKEYTSQIDSIDFKDFINRLPKYDNNLNNYYTHLIGGITDSDFTVVQTLALLDFSISQKELEKMFPPIQKKVIGKTINKIKPILKSGIVSGGIRIYHESFRRFVIDIGHKHGQKDKDQYHHITNWLEEEGFFVSQRAYRYLIPYLIRSREETKVYKLLETDFVTQSLFYFHPVEIMIANLNKIAEFSAYRQRWDKYCKAVELRRAIHTYDQDRFDLVERIYPQAILDVHGITMFCERLLFDGKPVYPATYGLLLCQMAHHAGGNPPWDFYDVHGQSMHMKDESQIRRFYEVESAHFLKQIRLLSKEQSLKLLKKMIDRNSIPNTDNLQIELLLKEFDFVFGVMNNYRLLIMLRLSKEKKISLEIKVAEYLFKNGLKEKARILCNRIVKKTDHINHIIQCILLGGDITSIKVTSDFEQMTKDVLSFESIYDSKKLAFENWYYTLRVLSFINPHLVKQTKKLVINIDGWYRAWVLYLFDISLVEASNIRKSEKEKVLFDALSKLDQYNNPFCGNPRAIDLYSIRLLSLDSFRRTLEMASSYSNYGKILKLLSNISLQSTSYLRGSSSGPLTGEDFNSILKNVSHILDEGKKIKTLELINNNTKEGKAFSAFYDALAIEYLNMCEMYSFNMKHSKAKACLMKSCIYLASYGFHKDTTIFEIIEPLKFIALKNLNFAIEGFESTFPLATIVSRYTDGKGTIGTLSYWLTALVDSNCKIALKTITDLVVISPRNDWRVEESTEYLCNRLLDNGIKLEVIAELYETINFNENVDFDVTVGLRLVSALQNEGNRKIAQQIFTQISRIIFRLSVTHYVGRKENFKEILSFARMYNLTMDKAYLTKFEQELNKESISYVSNAKTKPYSTIKTKSSPRFNFGKSSLAKILNLIDVNSSSYFLNKENVKKFGKALSRAGYNFSDVRDLILTLVRRRIYTDEDILGLIELRDIFLKKGKLELAAFISMLSFVYARGGNGWYSLADSNFNYLAKDALRLNKKVAENTLASEMSYLFTVSPYFIGPVRHFIEFFSRYQNIGMAKAIWNEAYEVIKFRLPHNSEEKKLISKETPSLKCNRKTSIMEHIKKLIDARRKIYIF